MTDNPYLSLPDRAFWRRAVAAPAPGEVDPVGRFDLVIDRSTKVATAGSCFAQHIARYLSRSGYHHYVVEPGHPILTPEVRDAFHYGQFSCRYGNIYTARQLLQLFRRAYGKFSPVDDAWTHEGEIVDPFRPTIHPHGFASLAEMRLDRVHHLAAVRNMFETLDVFVFTLGLTECWRSRRDGAVFPLCPGVEGGAFDEDLYEFHNQDVAEVIADLVNFRNGLSSVNKRAKIVFTVSPVPLVATAEPGEHVLSATTYSKSVLRVAAETMRERFSNVEYFPSYEIITGAFNRGAYFAPDLRGVVESGVSHVMRLFMQHATDGAAAAKPKKATKRKIDHLSLSERLVEVECDEVALDRP
jgi:hypothetical protein